MPAGSLPIRAVLFDADGVLQRGFSLNAQPLQDALKIPFGQLAACVEELFAAERNAVTGVHSLEKCVEHLPAQWGCRGTGADIIRAWTVGLEADPGMIAAIQSLRAAGIPCFLASNQGDSRARYMSEVVGYRRFLNREFYSCRVGHAKPDHQFFRFILREIGMRAEEVLFLDDNLENVNSARELGIQSIQFDCFRNQPWHEQLTDILLRHGISSNQI